QFLSCRVGIGLQESYGRQDESRHTEGALKALFINDSLLYRMQRSIGRGEALDGRDLSVAHGMGEDRARIVRHIVDQDGTSAAFGTVASQFSAGEAQLVANRPCQGFLFHHIYSPLLAVDVQGDQPLNRARDLRVVVVTGEAEQITRG